MPEAPLTEQEAQDWLEAHKRFEGSLADLGVAWGGVKKTTVARWVRAMEFNRLIVRHSDANGTVIEWNGRNASRPVERGTAERTERSAEPNAGTIEPSVPRNADAERSDTVPRNDGTLKKARKSARSTVPNGGTAERSAVPSEAVAPPSPERNDAERGTVHPPSVPRNADSGTLPRHDLLMAIRQELATFAETQPPVVRPAASNPPAAVEEPRFRLFAKSPKTRESRSGLARWLYLISISLAVVAVGIKAAFSHTLGATPISAFLWTAGSTLLDAFALLALAGAGQLARNGMWGRALAGVFAWGVCFMLAFLAAAGFASINVSDVTAAREKIATERAGHDEALVRHRAALAVLAPTRPEGALRTELQRLQPLVPPAVWRSSKGCSDITAAASGDACAEILAVRAEEARAAERARLAASIETAMDKLALLPPVTSADPQAQWTARLIAWTSRGLFNPAPEDIRLMVLFLIVVAFDLVPPIGFSMASGLDAVRRQP